MNVRIIERESRKHIFTYPIHHRGLNYKPTEEEYFKLAWQNAVEDGLVDKDRKGDYVVEFDE